MRNPRERKGVGLAKGIFHGRIRTRRFARRHQHPEPRARRAAAHRPARGCRPRRFRSAVRTGQSAFRPAGRSGARRRFAQPPRPLRRNRRAGVSPGAGAGAGPGFGSGLGSRASRRRRRATAGATRPTSPRTFPKENSRGAWAPGLLPEPAACRAAPCALAPHADVHPHAGQREEQQREAGEERDRLARLAEFGARVDMVEEPGQRR